MPADQFLLFGSAISLFALLLAVGKFLWHSKGKAFGVLAATLGLVALHTLAIWARYHFPGGRITMLGAPWTSLAVWFVSVAIAASFVVGSHTTVVGKLAVLISSVFATFFLGMLATLWIACASADCF